AALRAKRARGERAGTAPYGYGVNGDGKTLHTHEPLTTRRIRPAARSSGIGRSSSNAAAGDAIAGWASAGRRRLPMDASERRGRRDRGMCVCGAKAPADGRERASAAGNAIAGWASEERSRLPMDASEAAPRATRSRDGRLSEVACRWTRASPRSATRSSYEASERSERARRTERGGEAPSE